MLTRVSQRQAMLAINQAVGRVIRHRQDHGAIFFVDQRYDKNIRHLSSWVRNHIKPLGKEESVEAFFKTQV